MSTPETKRHFSMIRDFHLADFLTLANGLCDVVVIFQSLHFVQTGELPAIYLAAALIPLALIFDVLDSRVARSRGLASPFERELDSLADVISFGVAPAAIAYAVGLTTVVDQIALGFFVLCGLRLVKPKRIFSCLPVYVAADGCRLESLVRSFGAEIVPKAATSWRRCGRRACPEPADRA